MTDNQEATIKSRVDEARNRKAWAEVVEIKMAEAKDRGSKKRGWVVLRKSILTSSINYRMSLEERGVFVWLIVMADEIGPIPGLISDNDFREMPLDYLARVAHCPLEVFEAVLKKGIEDDSIYKNSHGIFLTHFDDYQFTEYDRQRPYREAKRQREKDTVNQQNRDNIARREREKRKGR
jgi:hypothetical protein